MPECDVCLAQCVAYLAKAPKSVAVYRAIGEVMSDVRESPNEPVPIHLRNAPTGLMREIGYGRGYAYPPDAGGPVRQDYLPDRLKGKRYLDTP
jgi:putative ATPase